MIRITIHKRFFSIVKPPSFGGNSRLHVVQKASLHAAYPVTVPCFTYNFSWNEQTRRVLGCQFQQQNEIHLQKVCTMWCAPMKRSTIRKQTDVSVTLFRNFTEPWHTKIAHTASSSRSWGRWYLFSSVCNVRIYFCRCSILLYFQKYVCNICRIFVATCI